MAGKKATVKETSVEEWAAMIAQMQDYTERSIKKKKKKVFTRHEYTKYKLTQFLYAYC